MAVYDGIADYIHTQQFWQNHGGEDPSVYDYRKDKKYWADRAARQSASEIELDAYGRMTPLAIERARREQAIRDASASMSREQEDKLARGRAIEQSNLRREEEANSIKLREDAATRDRQRESDERIANFLRMHANPETSGFKSMTNVIALADKASQFVSMGRMTEAAETVSAARKAAEAIPDSVRSVVASIDPSRLSRGAQADFDAYGSVLSGSIFNRQVQTAKGGTVTLASLMTDDSPEMREINSDRIRKAVPLATEDVVSSMLEKDGALSGAFASYRDALTRADSLPDAASEAEAKARRAEKTNAEANLRFASEVYVQMKKDSGLSKFADLPSGVEFFNRLADSELAKSGRDPMAAVELAKMCANTENGEVSIDAFLHRAETEVSAINSNATGPGLAPDPKDPSKTVHVPGTKSTADSDRDRYGEALAVWTTARKTVEGDLSEADVGSLNAVLRQVRDIEGGGVRLRGPFNGLTDAIVAKALMASGRDVTGAAVAKAQTLDRVIGMSTGILANALRVPSSTGFVSSSSDQMVQSAEARMFRDIAGDLVQAAQSPGMGLGMATYDGLHRKCADFYKERFSATEGLADTLASNAMSRVLASIGPAARTLMAGVPDAVGEPRSTMDVLSDYVGYAGPTQKVTEKDGTVREVPLIDTVVGKLDAAESGTKSYGRSLMSAGVAKSGEYETGKGVGSEFYKASSAVQLAEDAKVLSDKSAGYAKDTLDAIRRHSTDTKWNHSDAEMSRRALVEHVNPRATQLVLSRMGTDIGKDDARAVSRMLAGGRLSSNTATSGVSSDEEVSSINSVLDIAGKLCEDKDTDKSLAGAYLLSALALSVQNFKGYLREHRGETLVVGGALAKTGRSYDKNYGILLTAGEDLVGRLEQFDAKHGTGFSTMARSALNYGGEFSVADVNAAFVSTVADMNRNRSQLNPNPYECHFLQLFSEDGTYDPAREFWFIDNERYEAQIRKCNEDRAATDRSPDYQAAVRMFDQFGGGVASAPGRYAEAARKLAMDRAKALGLTDNETASYTTGIVDRMRLHTSTPSEAHKYLESVRDSGRLTVGFIGGKGDGTMSAIPPNYDLAVLMAAPSQVSVRSFPYHNLRELEALENMYYSGFKRSNIDTWQGALRDFNRKREAVSVYAGKQNTKPDDE